MYSTTPQRIRASLSPSQTSSNRGDGDGNGDRDRDRDGDRDRDEAGAGAGAGDGDGDGEGDGVAAHLCGTDSICLGCSGYHYDHWLRGVYYPLSSRRKSMFSFYCREFNNVELNATFYRLPAITTFTKWRQDVPRPSFRYSVKASQYFTHWKRLKVDESFRLRWHEFAKRVSILGENLGVVLFQLPPNLGKSIAALEALAQALPTKERARLTKTATKTTKTTMVTDIAIAFEFRDASWFCEEVYQVLRKYNWCCVQTHVHTSKCRDRDWGWG